MIFFLLEPLLCDVWIRSNYGCFFFIVDLICVGASFGSWFGRMCVRPGSGVESSSGRDRDCSRSCDESLSRCFVAQTPQQMILRYVTWVFVDYWVTLSER